MSHRNRILNRGTECYENSKERLREQEQINKENYQMEKKHKKEYGRDSHHNMSIAKNKDLKNTKKIIVKQKNN